MRESALERGLDIELQHFALQFLRTLLAFALRLIEELSEIVDLFVLLLELERLLLADTLADALFNAPLLGIQFARDFEVELAAALFQLSLFLAQRKLRLLCIAHFSLLLGELRPKFFQLKSERLRGGSASVRNRALESPLIVDPEAPFDLALKLCAQSFGEREAMRAGRTSDNSSVQRGLFSCESRSRRAQAAGSSGLRPWRRCGQRRSVARRSCRALLRLPC